MYNVDIAFEFPDSQENVYTGTEVSNLIKKYMRMKRSDPLRKVTSYFQSPFASVN